MPAHVPGPEAIVEEAIVVPDILAPRLHVVFCGLNPRFKFRNTSAALRKPDQSVLARSPSGRLYAVGDGLTESRNLLHYGIGLTSAVRRPTMASTELTPREFVAGADALRHRISASAPAHIAFMGKAAYRAIHRRTSVDWGEQDEAFAGARTWVLPNTSGISRFTLDALVAAYKPLRNVAFTNRHRST